MYKILSDLKLFTICVLMWAYCSQTLAVDTVGVLSSQFSSSSRTVAINVQPAFDNFYEQFSGSFFLEGLNSNSKSNYNAELEDFEIKKTGGNFGLNLDWNKMIFLGGEVGQENLSDKTVKNTLVHSTLGFRWSDLNIKFRLSDVYVRQLTEYIVLTRDVKNQLTLRKNSPSVTLAYSGLENFSFILSHTSHNYDTDVEALTLLTTTKNPLINNGAGFISQISGLLEKESRLEMIYSLNDEWDLEFSFGEATEFLTPFTLTRDIRLGFTYYGENVSVGLGATTLQAEGESNTTSSGDFSLTYDFF